MCRDKRGGKLECVGARKAECWNVSEHEGRNVGMCRNRKGGMLERNKKGGTTVGWKEDIALAFQNARLAAGADKTKVELGEPGIDVH